MNALTTSAANTGLFTDLYELTMAAGYWKAGLAEREAVFQLFFRQHPFGGGYTIAGGLADAIKHLQRLRFGDPEREYLASLKGGGDRPLFEGGFLDHLGQLRFTGDVAAVPEGTVMFPQEPLVRVQGPLLQAQIVETMLLQTINFQSLLATKAARICQAADGDPVIEFGLRRAQGGDGALAAARAAYIGGCAGTSNVLAARRLGIPVKGTHAHSFVMAFPSELEAFDAYVHAMPDNSILLVDTYDTLEGVCHAVTTGRRLRARGHELAGIRLDSGELGRLSIEARRMLDEAGFPEAVIVASNDLDEHQIARLKAQGARIDVWGVGTKLITAHDEPALGGVYKLAALRDSAGTWQPCIKRSDQPAKTTNPGILQVRRFSSGNRLVGDILFDASQQLPADLTMVDLRDPARRSRFNSGEEHEDLLVPVVRQGRPVGEQPTLGAIRNRAREQLARLAPEMKRFENPDAYPVGLEITLHENKDRLLRGIRSTGK